MSKAPRRPLLRSLILLLTRIGVAVGILVSLGTMGGVVWLRTPQGNLKLARWVLPLIQPYTGSVELDSLETDLLSSLRLKGLRVKDITGKTLVDIPETSINYHLGSLPAGLVVVDSLSMLGGKVDVSCPSSCDVMDMWSDPSAPPSPAGKLPVEIRVDSVLLGFDQLAVETAAGRVAGNLELTGELTLWDQSAMGRSLHIAGNLEGPGVPIQPVEMSFSGSMLNLDTLLIDQLDARWAGQEVAVLGSIGDLDGDPMIGLTLQKIYIDPALLPPNLGLPSVQGPLSGQGTLQGRLTNPLLSLVVDTPGGSLQLDGQTNTNDQTWRATLTAPSFLPHALLAELPDVTWSGTITTVGTGYSPQGLVGALQLDGTLAQLPEIGAVNIHGTARVEGGDMTVLYLDQGTITGPGISLGAGARVMLDAGYNPTEITSVIQNIEVDLSYLQKTRRIVGLVPELSAALEPQLQILDSLPLIQGHLGFSGTLTQKDSMDLEGALKLTGFAAQGLASLGNLSGSLSAHMGDEITATTNLSLNQLVIPGLDTSDFATHGTLDLNYGPRTSWDIKLNRGDLPALVSRGSLEGSHLNVAELLARAPEKYGDYRAEATISLDLEEMGARNIHLDASAFTADDKKIVVLAGTGRLSEQGAQDFSLTLKDLALSALKPDWTGGASATLTLTGPLARPRLTAEANAIDVVIPGSVRHLSGNLSLNGEGDWVSLTGSATGPKGTLGSLNARLPVHVAPLEITREVPKGDDPIATYLGRALRPQGELSGNITIPPAALPALTEFIDPGRMGSGLPPYLLSGAVALGGKLADPTLKFASTMRGLMGAEVLQLDLDARLVDEKLVLDGTIWEQHTPKIRLEGSIPLRIRTMVNDLLQGQMPDPANAIGKLDVNVIARSFPLAYVLKSTNQDLPIQGGVVGAMHVGGVWTSPEVEGAFFISDGRIGEVEVKPAVLTISPATQDVAEKNDTGYMLHLDTGFGEGTGLMVEAFVPIHLDPSRFGDVDAMMTAPGLAIKVRGDGVPIALAGAFVPGFREGVGNLIVRGDISGSLASPVPHLNFSMENAGFTLDSTAISYRDLAVKGFIDGKNAFVERFAVRTEVAGGDIDPSPSTMVAELAAELGDDWFPVLMEGQATLNGFRVSALPDQSIRISGKPTLNVLGGKVWMRGTIDVDRALIRLKEDFFSESSDTMLHPDIVIVGRERGHLDPEDGLAGMLAMIPPWLKIALDVHLSDAIRGAVAMPLEDRYGALGREFSTVRVDGEIAGDMRVEASYRTLNILGELEPKRGQARLLGRIFDIEEGTLAFTGRDVFSPLVDVTASYTTSNYGAMRVRIQGTPDAPKLSFSSDSYGEEDVLAILLTGRPASEAGEAGDAAVLGQTAAMALAALAQNTLGHQGGSGVVESVQFDTMGVQGGFRVSRDVSLYTRYNYAGDPTEGSMLEISVEWSLPNEWSMQFVTGGGNGNQISAWRTWKF